MTPNHYCFQFRITRSKEIFLSKCRLYHVEMLMVNGGKYNSSIGIKLPNGTYEGTIGKDRLFWVRPGKGSLKRILQDKSVESKHYQHLCQTVGQKKKKKKKTGTLVLYLTFLSSIMRTSFQCICSGTYFYFHFF